MTSRKRGVISYKESSGEVSDSEQGEMEGEAGEGVMEVEDNRECIEKVLKKRKGKVGSKSMEGKERGRGREKEREREREREVLITLFFLILFFYV